MDESLSSPTNSCLFVFIRGSSVFTLSKQMNAWRITGRVCAVVVLVSVLACVWMAIARSRGLVAVTVTALDPAAEPSDHKIPFVKQREALPDYELSLIGDDGDSRYLGVKSDESAAAGLTWQLDDPVSVSQIAAVRLREKDKMVSDEVAEVHVSAPSVESNGYRFDFKTSRSIGVGVRAFFATPIGIAIMTAFGIAVLLIVLANFSV
jgi:hypothetical protein